MLLGGDAMNKIPPIPGMENKRVKEKSKEVGVGRRTDTRISVWRC